jgi:AbrB family looped-hinge helix DNA binding protein
MVLNSKGQVTIPAHLRAKYGLHVGDEVEVVDVGGAQSGGCVTPPAVATSLA